MWDKRIEVTVGGLFILTFFSFIIGFFARNINISDTVVASMIAISCLYIGRLW